MLGERRGSEGHFPFWHFLAALYVGIVDAQLHRPCLDGNHYASAARSESQNPHDRTPVRGRLDSSTKLVVTPSPLSPEMRRVEAEYLCAPSEEGRSPSVGSRVTQLAHYAAPRAGCLDSSLQFAITDLQSYTA